MKLVYSSCLFLVRLLAAADTSPAAQMPEGRCSAGSCPDVAEALASEEGSCIGGLCAEHIGLLQRRQNMLEQQRLDASLSTESQWRRQVPIGKTAIAFAGGGFLSVADFTASIMGFLAHFGTSGSLTHLLKKFDIVVGTSGGSWFWNMLAYSSSFQTLVETCALNPRSAGTLYNANFQIKSLLDFKQQAEGANIFQCLRIKDDVKRLLNESKGKLLDKIGADTHGKSSHHFKWAPTWKQTLDGLDDALDRLPPQLNEEKKTGKHNVYRLRHKPVPSFKKLLKSLPPALAKEYTIAAFSILLSSDGLHWDDVVKHILLASAGIGNRLPMGTGQVNAWARGKVGMMTATAVTPSKLRKNDMDWVDDTQEAPPKVTIYNKGGNVLTYTAKHGDYNFAQPVRFSVILGGGENQDSAMPFCTSSQCQTYEATYKLNHQTLGTQNLASRFKKAFDTHAGKIPIAGASASSSAAAGLFVLEDPIADQNCATAAVWTTNVKNGNSFHAAKWTRNFLFNAANLRVEKHWARRVERQALMPLIDGAFSDDSAVANAVAAGASEVLAFQDLSDQHPNTRNPLVLATLFRGSPTAGTVIFQEPSFDEFVHLYENSLNEIYPSAEDTRFLKRIRWGSVHCVTQQNDYFGIEAGRRVTLNVWAPLVLNISMGTPTAGFPGVFSYGTLVQEIVTTLLASPQTQEILQKFF